jgi:hypothetical protein
LGQGGGAGHAPHRGQGQASGQGACGTTCCKRSRPIDPTRICLKPRYHGEVRDLDTTPSQDLATEFKLHLAGSITLRSSGTGFQRASPASGQPLSYDVKPLPEEIMVRNWEIIRAILFRLENSNTPNVHINANSFNEFDEQEVAYNMRLLDEAGLIEAKIKNSSDGSGKILLAAATRLTNGGHDLLDTIRNETVWDKIKDKFAKSELDMTFDLVVAVGKKIMEVILA